MKPGGAQRALIVLGVINLLLTNHVSFPDFVSPAKAEGLVANDSGAYVVKSWRSQDGLPQNTVRCLLQTRDGYLWIGTRAGLARFEGLHFTTFNKANTPQMLSDDCVMLVQAPDDSVWIGTEGGLLRWQEHHFTSFDLGEANAANRGVRYLSVGRDNGLWVAGWNGLYYLQRGKVTRYTTADGLQANNIRAVFEDTKGNIWVGTEMSQFFGGLQRRSLNASQFIPVPGQGTNLPFMVHCFLEDRDGSLWWGNNAGLHQLSGENIRDYHMEDGLPGSVVRRLAACRDNGLLVVIADRDEVPGHRGLVKSKSPVRRFQSNLLPDYAKEYDLICAIEDFEGNIWVGTRYEGLICLRRRLFASYSASDDLSDDRVNTVCETGDRAILVGTAKHLSQIQGGKITPKVPEFAVGPVRALLKDGLGRVWVAGGLNVPAENFLYCSVLPGRDFYSYALLEELGNASINCLGTDLEHWLWIGQPDGVTRFNFRVRSDDNAIHAPPQKRHFTTRDGLSNNDVRTILSDHAGNVWLGTFGGGLNRWRDGTFAAFTTADGLCSDFIRTLFEDSEHTLWIGTDTGLNRLKDGRFATVTRKEGLFSDSINQILEDNFGYLWLGCHHGILRVNRNELKAVADGRASAIEPILFGEADGLPSSEISSFQPGACKSSDGRLWFPTVKGLAVIDPKNLSLNQVPPPVVIEQVKADDEIIYGDDVTAPVKARSGLTNSTSFQSQIGNPKSVCRPGAPVFWRFITRPIASSHRRKSVSSTGWKATIQVGLMPEAAVKLTTPICLPVIIVFISRRAIITESGARPMRNSLFLSRPTFIRRIRFTSLAPWQLCSRARVCIGCA